MLNEALKWFYRRRALNCMTESRPDRAERWYKKLEVMEPESIQVLHNLGVISISLKKFREAERYILREIELFGESALRFRILGDLYYLEGDMGRAKEAYSRALVLTGESGNDRSAGNLMKKRIAICGDKKLSAKAAESATLLEKGQELLSGGMIAGALEAFLRAAEYDRSSYMALNSAGTVYLNHMKDYTRAKGCFRRALELADLPLVRQNLMLAEHNLKETGANQ
jgi:tetratricopeptide (TPR) repeat protein